MDISIKDSGGVNIIVREQVLPRYYPAPTTDVAYIMLSKDEADAAPGSGQKYGPFKPGQMVKIDFNPVQDRNPIVRGMSYSASGVPHCATWSDAVAATVLFNRETAAPVIGQYGDATTDTMTIAVSGFTPYAHKRRVRRATSLSGGALVSPTEEIFDSGMDTVPDFIDIMKHTGETTIYVAVAHSSGTAWTPDSNILAIRFATVDTSGNTTGGTIGTFDPTPRDQYL